MRSYTRWIRWSAVFALAALSCGSAYASGRHEHWEKVKGLARGKVIRVELQHGAPESCRLVVVDDDALTCDREADPNANWAPRDNARITVPKDAVREVRVWDDVSDRRVLIRVGAGFAIGTLACALLGPAPAFICGGIGAIIGLTAPELAEPRPLYPWPGFPPRTSSAPEPDWRLKPVYRAPV